VNPESSDQRTHPQSQQSYESCEGQTFNTYPQAPKVWPLHCKYRESPQVLKYLFSFYCWSLSGFSSGGGYIEMQRVEEAIGHGSGELGLLSYSYPSFRAFSYSSFTYSFEETKHRENNR
jgi:hypothetical protein